MCDSIQSVQKHVQLLLLFEHCTCQFTQEVITRQISKEALWSQRRRKGLHRPRKMIIADVKLAKYSSGATLEAFSALMYSVY